jgi:hypothetical protein
MKHIFFISLFFLIFSLQLFSQQLNSPLTNDYNSDYEKALYAPNNNFHTSAKPWLIPEINKVVNTDSLKNTYFLKSNSRKKFCTAFHNKVFNENLITLDKDGFQLTVDPVFNFEIGKDFATNESHTFTNTRGLQVEGSIGNKFSFFSTFYENQSTFIHYLDSNIRSMGVIPGQGSYKGFGKSGFDYAWASAYISYTPSKYFNFQFGHGKNFFGDGYRSLLLSDNAFNYPYLKITTNVWRFKYINLFAQFQDLMTPHASWQAYNKKYGTFHYLSYSVNKRLDVSFFEAIIWKASDSNGYRGFEINYLDPVIFYRPVEFSLGSPDNALMGLNVSYKIRHSNVLYGQLLLDEFKLHEILAGNGWWGNKQAFQLGIKSFDLFNLRNLSFQTEFNYARPYTYSHESTLTNYGHYNQSLADPLGANFKESVSFLKYNFKRFFVELKFNYAMYGADSGKTDYGKNIFLPYTDRPKEYGVYTLQGIKTTLIYKDFRISYLVNPATNFNISLGFSDRTETSSITNKHSMYVYFGIRTSLNNFYYDF